MRCQAGLAGSTIQKPAADLAFKIGNLFTDS